MGGLQCTATNKETKQVVQFNLELDDDKSYSVNKNRSLLDQIIDEGVSQAGGYFSTEGSTGESALTTQANPPVSTTDISSTKAISDTSQT